SSTCSRESSSRGSGVGERLINCVIGARIGTLRASRSSVQAGDQPEPRRRQTPHMPSAITAVRRLRAGAAVAALTLIAAGPVHAKGVAANPDDCTPIAATLQPFAPFGDG